MPPLSSDPFQTLNDAWQQGRPIVPLFGAGISIGSGIPPTPPMLEYLARVYWHRSAAYQHHPLLPHHTIARRLLAEGWPERHDLNAEIRRTLDDEGMNARDVMLTITDEVLTAEKIPFDGASGWNVLLNRLCDGNQALKDLFFDRFEMGRRPSLAHQFSAYLTSLMNWRLILTTNFDHLIEQALTAQNLEPTIYELPEQGPVPHFKLIGGHLSLVKLHGGAYGRRISESLDFSLTDADRELLRRYFPPNPLLLILGYGGGDRRVMSLIEALVRAGDGREWPEYPYEGDPQHNNPRVLWIHYPEEAPNQLNTIIQDLAEENRTRVVAHHYRNGARFLQELYCRLVTCHPVSTTSYRAFPQMAPSIAKNQCSEQADHHLSRPSDERRGGNGLDASVVFFLSDTAGAGTSTRLAEAAHGLTGYVVVWCDLETITTIDGLVTFLQNRFRRFDPGLPPFAIFQTQRESLSVISPQRDPRVVYVLEAMRRGKYAIAIDSIGEFGRSLWWYADKITSAPMSAERELANEELVSLYDFLIALIEKRATFGDSRLLLAHTLPEGMNETARDKARSFLKMVRGLSKQDLEVVPLQPPQLAQTVDLRTTESLLGLTETDLNMTVGDYAQTSWSRLELKDPVYQATLAFASCFRRRRDIVVLRRLIYGFFSHNACGGSTRPALESIVAMITDFNLTSLDKGIRQKDRKQIDKILDDLNGICLLRRQEGGFFWMHRGVRDFIYSKLQNVVGPNNPATLARVHDLIASYYYTEVFRPSNDLAALFEYVFHRLLSLLCVEEQDKVHRLRDLMVILDRERDHLLRHSHAGMLLRCIARCREIAVNVTSELPSPGGKVLQEQRDLERILCDLEGEALRQASHFNRCIDLRKRQALLCLHEQQVDRATSSLSPLDNVQAYLSDPRNGSNVGHCLEVFNAGLTAVETLMPGEDVQRPTGAEVAHKFLGFLDPVIEIGACCHGSAGLEDSTPVGVASQPRRRSPQLRRRIAANQEQVCALLDCVQRILNRCGERQPSERAQIGDAKVRCAIRTMEAHLGAVCPWSQQTHRSTHIEAAIAAFGVGNDVLQEYVGFRDRKYHHYACFLNTHRARAAYLQEREFSQAYQFLDAARAAIRRPDKGSEFSALAIVDLHQAECLMHHADAILRDWANNDLNDDTMIHDASPRSAKEKLKRAETALRQAHLRLERGRPQVWAWTWLRLLQAQLEHELFISSFDFQQEKPDRREMIEKGLGSIRRGLDSARPEPRRVLGLEVLWWQLLICYAVCEVADHQTSDQAIREKWERLNKRFGLLEFQLARKKEIRMVSREMTIACTAWFDEPSDLRNTPGAREAGNTATLAETTAVRRRGAILQQEERLLQLKGLPLEGAPTN